MHTSRDIHAAECISGVLTFYFFPGKYAPKLSWNTGNKSSELTRYIVAPTVQFPRIAFDVERISEMSS